MCRSPPGPWSATAFRSDRATFVVASREEAVLPKERLLEIGGTREGIRKWASK